MKYDPRQFVDPESWQRSSEGDRLIAVTEYHRRYKIPTPNENIHAVIHVIVENQVALGDDYPAKAVLARLMCEGLHRHEAIHAIGSVLAEQLFNVLKHKDTQSDVNAEYQKKLHQLSAESWRKLGS